ncbi:hypothetical protein E2I00_000652, partial [Balaenoptera physalus]
LRVPICHTDTSFGPQGNVYIHKTTSLCSLGSDTKVRHVTCQGRYLWFALYLLPQSLFLEWSICLDPTCATKRAMAWECPSKPSSPPAEPNVARQAHSVKPSAPRGRWPSLGTRPEQLPLPVHCQACAPCVTDQMPSFLTLDSSAKQQGTVNSLRNGRLGASGTAQPCSQLTCKMWTALVLIWVSSWSLSESHLTLQHPVLNKTLENSEQNSSVEAIARVLNETSERMTSVTPSPATLTRGTWGGDPTSPVALNASTRGPTVQAPTPLTAADAATSLLTGPREQESWRAAREAAFPGQVCSHQLCDPEWSVVDSGAPPGHRGDSLSVMAPRGMLPGAIPGGELTLAFSTTLNPEEETILPGDSSFPSQSLLSQA